MRILTVEKKTFSRNDAIYPEHTRIALKVIKHEQLISANIKCRRYQIIVSPAKNYQQRACSTKAWYRARVSRTPPDWRCNEIREQQQPCKQQQYDNAITERLTTTLFCMVLDPFL